MLKSYRNMLKNSFNFKGTTKKSDYWWALLEAYILTLLLMVVLGLPARLCPPGVKDIYVAALYAILILIQWPLIPLYVRRMNETAYDAAAKWALGLLLPISNLLVAGFLKADGPKEKISRKEYLLRQLEPLISEGLMQVLCENEIAMSGRMLNRYLWVVFYHTVTQDSSDPQMILIDENDKLIQFPPNTKTLEAIRQDAGTSPEAASEALLALEKTLQEQLKQLERSERPRRKRSQINPYLLILGVSCPMYGIFISSMLNLMSQPFIMICYIIGMFFMLPFFILGVVNFVTGIRSASVPLMQLLPDEVRPKLVVALKTGNELA